LQEFPFKEQGGKTNLIMKLLATAFFFSLCLFVSAQTLDNIQNEYIIQLEDKLDGFSFFQKIKKENALLGNAQMESQISKRLNLYKVSFQSLDTDAKVVLENFRQFPEIILAGQNFQVEPRTNTPDDTRYAEQWGMEVINAPEVWEVTTGGVTALGDTIVIAVVEGGDYNHEDLIDNLWINHNEIDNDGIDNDGNGYIDDK